MNVSQFLMCSLLVRDAPMNLHQLCEKVCILFKIFINLKMKENKKERRKNSGLLFLCTGNVFREQSGKKRLNLWLEISVPSLILIGNRGSKNISCSCFCNSWSWVKQWAKRSFTFGQGFYWVMLGSITSGKKGR